MVNGNWDHLLSNIGVVGGVAKFVLKHVDRHRLVLVAICFCGHSSIRFTAHDLLIYFYALMFSLELLDLQDVLADLVEVFALKLLVLLKNCVLLDVSQH